MKGDEFYTGYLPEAPPGIARRTRTAVAVVFVLAVTLAVVLVASQRPFSSAVFEFGTLRTFEGVARLAPEPHLEVERPGRADDPVSRFYLVAPGKHGARPALAGLDGRRVRLEGTLVYRGDQTMIEVVPSTVEAVAEGTPPADDVSLGRHTLIGEIVDSKCWLGVMKPGAGKPHRACASLCIRGGSPPLFVVRDADGPASQLLLVGDDGRPIGTEILDLVAEPVEITGEAVRRGDLLVLRADPSGIRRLP